VTSRSTSDDSAYRPTYKTDNADFPFGVFSFGVGHDNRMGCIEFTRKHEKSADGGDSKKKADDFSLNERM